MFSGQGSQYFHMGQQLYARSPHFRRSMDEMDVLVADLCGYSVLSTLYDPGKNKADAFDSLPLTHPALFMVEWATAQTLMAHGVEPDFVLGVSLGTYVAAALAGAFSWETALTAVSLQARVIERHAQRGAMFAVMSDDDPLVDPWLAVRCEVAAYNFATHRVLSVPLNQVGAVETYLRARNFQAQRLPVTFPFHSRWMEDIRPSLEQSLGSLHAPAMRLPLACSAATHVLTHIPEGHFWRVVRQPIRFGATIESIERAGPFRYVDAGPSGTLATFLRYALPAGSGSKAHATLSPFGGDLKRLDALGISLP